MIRRSHRGYSLLRSLGFPNKSYSFLPELKRINISQDIAEKPESLQFVKIFQHSEKAAASNEVRCKILIGGEGRLSLSRTRWEVCHLI